MAAEITYRAADSYGDRFNIARLTFQSLDTNRMSLLTKAKSFTGIITHKYAFAAFRNDKPIAVVFYSEARPSEDGPIKTDGSMHVEAILSSTRGTSINSSKVIKTLCLHTLDDIEKRGCHTVTFNVPDAKYELQGMMYKMREASVVDLAYSSFSKGMEIKASVQNLKSFLRRTFMMPGGSRLISTKSVYDAIPRFE